MVAPVLWVVWNSVGGCQYCTQNPTQNYRQDHLQGTQQALDYKESTTGRLCMPVCPVDVLKDDRTRNAAYYTALYKYTYYSYSYIHIKFKTRVKNSKSEQLNDKL